MRNQTNTKASLIALAVLLVGTLAACLPVEASGICQPQYFLFGKSAGEPSILAYVMQNTGDCEWHILRRLYFTDNRLDSVQSLRYGSYNHAFADSGRVLPQL